MDKFKLLDVVAITEDIPEHHLRRGQVGTIVEVFENGKAVEVEFADQQGHTYQSVGIEPSRLIVLQYDPEAVPA